MIKQLIRFGRTTDLAGKVDVFYARGKLTDEEYAEITAALDESGG